MDASVGMRRTSMWSAVATFCVLLVLAGCSPTFRPAFVASGAPLDSAGTQRLARATALGKLTAVETGRAPVLRAQALAYLRTLGPAGSRAADLLTVGFPARTPSVPVLVRVCRVDGRAAVVVVEAWGVPGGTLDRHRLWIFDRVTGGIIGAAAFR